MIPRTELILYGEVQAVAKRVLCQLRDLLQPGMSEADVAALAKSLLEAEGVAETWYYDVPAFVLGGDRSILSISGRDYRPSADIKLLKNEIVTIDLSPSVHGRWGDCARTFCVGSHSLSSSIREGMEAEEELHRDLLGWAAPDATFHDVFLRMNERVEQLGFENLDFAGNLGHSIELHREERIYVEAHNHIQLSEVTMFTFEPHIRRPGSKIGVKHENIYYFDDAGRLTEL